MGKGELVSRRLPGGSWQSPVPPGSHKPHAEPDERGVAAGLWPCSSPH